MGDVKYVLLWEVSGRSLRHEVMHNELFIGRLPRGISKNVKEYTPFQVYIYYPLTNEAYPTGYESLTVSRLHAKLVIEGSSVLIKDHGLHGEGSKNGLIVNGERLPRGGSARLSPGSTFKLGYLGPLFTLLVKTPLGDAISLIENVPTHLPKTLANELAKEGSVKVLATSGNEALVIPIGFGERRLSDYLVRTERVSNDVRRSKILRTLLCRIFDAIELIMQGERESYVNVLRELSLDVFKNAINELSDNKLKEEYAWLVKQVDNIDYVDEETLLTRLRRLRKMIEDIMNISI